MTVSLPDQGPSTARRGARSGPLALAIAVVAVLAGSALFLSGFALGSLRATTPGTPVDEQAAFQPFWDTYRSITQDYAGGPVDRKTLVEGAIRGMIASLDDPFSAYLSPEEYRQSLQGLSGQFEGIGAQVQARRMSGTGDCPTLGGACALAVVEPIAGGPAEKAGVLAGDRITAIDGSTVDGQTADQALARVRGPKGTSVSLTIVRGTGAPFDLVIVRDVIVQREVVARSLAGGALGYVKLSGFSDRAAEQFGAAIAADVAAGRHKLIVDLRGNPGGFVTDAQRVVSQFLPAGTTIFLQEDASGARTPTLAQPEGAATDPSIQMAVLIDGGSASASEIVAGALQDLGRAKLVGSTSYGKGTIQVWLQLADDNGGYRLTVAKWLTPAGRWIHGHGLVPDVVVDAAGAAAGSDPTLDRALELLGEPASAGRGLSRAA
ncbi:MAG: carboxyl-terminal processing protease [Chloroflexota bacterium]|nr:carboxyl-terminal processing protease [Chloroflexota bacterium]